MSLRARQRSLLKRLAALAIGCALLLLCASIAVARPGHGAQGQNNQSQASEQEGGHGHGRGKEAAEAPSANAGHGHGSSEGDAHGQGSGDGAGQGESHDHGHGHDGGGPSAGNEAEHGRGHSEHGKDHGSAGSSAQGTGAAGGESNGAAAGKGKAPGARHTRAAATNPSTPAATTAQSSSATPAAASATTAIPAPAPAATTPQPAAPATVAPTAGSSHAQSAAHGRGVRRAARKARAPHPATHTLASTLTPVTLAAAAPAAGGGSVRAAHAGHHTNDKPANSQPPIVQTITKIVGVIPLAVWIAGGALLALALALAAGSRLLAKRAQRLERQRGELLADVGLLQTALLPAAALGAGPIGASVAFRPADGPAAGGDFYDVFTLEDGTIAAIVGDVSGHGRAALPHTALLRFTLRAYLEAGLSPREALHTAGAVLERQLDGALATAVLATYHPHERTLVYSSAGHPPPIVLGKRQLQPLGSSSAPPIGAGMTTGTRQTVVSLPGAAQVCLHTDGVTDARIDSELYGSERLARALASLGPQATAPELLQRVGEQTDARPDDMAACLLSLAGEAIEPRTLVQELEIYDGDGAHERAERFLLACGLDLRQSARVAAEACERARQAGSVLIEAHPSGPGAGAPSARVRRDDLPDIHASDARRLATVGGTR